METVRHFHVLTSSRNGMVLGEVRYQDAEKSVADFISIARNVFKGQEVVEKSINEVALLEQATQSDHTFMIYVDCNTSFRLWWASCDECEPLPIHN